MSNPYMTTAYGSKFPVQDVTFRNARRQSEVAREIAEEKGLTETADGVPVPVSLTPEQVKKFLMDKSTKVDANESRVYQQAVKWIDEMLSTRKKLVALEMKQAKDTTDTTNDDIGADTV